MKKVVLPMDVDEAEDPSSGMATDTALNGISNANGDSLQWPLCRSKPPM